MQFVVEALIQAPREAVVRAIADSGYYRALGEMSELAPPEVLHRREEDGVVRLRVRFAFAGNISAAARAVLDPGKLTWVTELDVHLSESRASFTMLPEHYADRLECSGSYRFEAVGEATRQVVSTELVVHFPMLGGAVERAIAGGFRQHLGQQAELLSRWAAEH